MSAEHDLKELLQHLARLFGAHEEGGAAAATTEDDPEDERASGDLPEDAAGGDTGDGAAAPEEEEVVYEVVPDGRGFFEQLVEPGEDGPPSDVESDEAPEEEEEKPGAPGDASRDAGPRPVEVSARAYLVGAKDKPPVLITVDAGGVAAPGAAAGQPGGVPPAPAGGKDGGVPTSEPGDPSGDPHSTQGKSPNAAAPGTAPANDRVVAEPKEGAKPDEKKDEKPPDDPKRLGGRKWLSEQKEIKGNDRIEQREQAFLEQFAKKNYPDFCNVFCPVALTDKKGHHATFQVSCDFFAIGTNEDYIRMPLSAYTAQKVANELGCFLPTAKLVLAIYAQAARKLIAHPIDCQGRGRGGWWQRSNIATRWHEDITQGVLPCASGTPVPGDIAAKFDPRFTFNHRGKCSISNPHPCVLVSGHKKEVIISHENLAKKLAFWGYFDDKGKAIQSGFGCRHGPGFSDASHGVRLVKSDVDVDGKTVSYEDIVKDKDYAELLIDGGVPYATARYPDPPVRFEMGN